MNARGRRKPRRAATAALLVAASACALLATPSCEGCHDAPPATSVRIVLATGTPVGEDGARRLRTDRGHEVTLTEARVAVSTVELVTCEADGRDAGAARGLAGRAVEALAAFGRGLGAGRARAHSPSTSTRLGVPHVVDLARAADVEAGILEPPTVPFCSVRLVLGPADDDAVGLPDAAFVGSTARVAGTVDGAPLRGASDGTVTVWPALAEPLRLDAARREATVRVVLGDGRLLDGLDLRAATERQVGFGVLLGVEAAARAEVRP